MSDDQGIPPYTPPDPILVAIGQFHIACTQLFDVVRREIYKLRSENDRLIKLVNEKINEELETATVEESRWWQK